MYYWATKEKPQSYIAATILTPIEQSPKNK